ncbi:hypothetical protein FB451DRAFT_1240452 [Mycena latifolia]|nr:hypothetical protein FB451DRAFT_1240452 [Mycena latifolia]
MHIPFSVFLSLALALPTLAAPMVYGNNTEAVSAPTPEQRIGVLGPLPTGIVEGELALEARKAKAKIGAKKPVAVKKPVKVPVKPKAKPVVKPKPATKKPAATKVPAKTGKTPIKTPVKTPVKPVNGTKTATKKPVAKPSGKAIASKLPTKSKSASAKPAATSAKGKACPLKPTTKKTKTSSRIKARANVRHPSGTGDIILFHGTSPTAAEAVEDKGVDLSKTASRGDFSHRPESDGGFYMTDSLIAAAQFACHEHTIPRGAEVDVLEFSWRGAGMSVKEFPSADAEFDSFLEYNEGPDTDSEDVPNEDDPFRTEALEIYENDMITGPLPPNGVFDVDLNKVLFHQYAVIKQAAADSNLVLTTRHRTILCKNVPKKTALTAEMYTDTQGGNANFATAVAALQDPDGCA